MAKAAAKKTLSKSQILANIAEATGLAKKDVGAVIEALGGEIKKALGARGPGVIAVAGLVVVFRDVTEQLAVERRRGQLVLRHLTVHAGDVDEQADLEDERAGLRDRHAELRPQVAGGRRW